MSQIQSVEIEIRDNPALKVVTIHGEGTLPDPLRAKVNHLILSTGIPDTLGVPDAITYLNDPTHSLHVIGQSGNQVMGHIGITFHEGPFGKFDQATTERLIQVRSVASLVHKKGIFSTMMRSFLDRFLGGDENVQKLAFMGGVNWKGLNLVRTFEVMRNPIMLMSSTTHAFAEAFGRMLLTEYGFSYDSDAVRAATADSYQFVLTNEDPDPNLTIITGQSTHTEINGHNVPVRLDTTAIYDLNYAPAAAVLRAHQGDGYDGRINLNNDEAIVMLGHSPAVHAKILEDLKKNILAGRDSIIDASQSSMRIVMEKP